MADLLTRRPPTSVIVGEERAPIECGWRLAVRSYSVRDEAGARALVLSWFSRPDGGLPPVVAADPAAALEAALAWRDDPLEAAMPYGDGRPRRSSARDFDWVSDGAIVVADFRRLYGIDLSTWQAHWWDFCALFAPLAATEGSLVGQAIAARQPTPAGTGREQRRALSRLRRAWALPPTDDELVRQANERIRREW